MSLKEIDKPVRMPKTSYMYTMAAKGKTGGPAFDALSCKEEFFHSVGKAIAFDYSEEALEDVIGVDYFDDEINVEEPGLFIFLSRDFYDRDAYRVEKIARLLHENHKLDSKPEIFKVKDTTALLLNFDPFYFKNSVVLSGFLTFIRLAAWSSFEFESIKDFIKKSKETKGPYKDPYHISESRISGNLKLFLKKKLSILELKNGWHLGMEGDTPWPGIVSYDMTESYYVDLSDGPVIDKDYECFSDYEDDCECPVCI